MKDFLFKNNIKKLCDSLQLMIDGFDSHIDEQISQARTLVVQSVGQEIDPKEIYALLLRDHGEPMTRKMLDVMREAYGNIKHGLESHPNQTMTFDQFNAKAQDAFAKSLYVHIPSVDKRTSHLDGIKIVNIAFSSSLTREWNAMVEQQHAGSRGDMHR